MKILLMLLGLLLLPVVAFCSATASVGTVSDMRYGTGPQLGFTNVQPITKQFSFVENLNDTTLPGYRSVGTSSDLAFNQGLLSVSGGYGYSVFSLYGVPNTYYSDVHTKISVKLW